MDSVEQQSDDELTFLRRRVAELEQSATELRGVEEALRKSQERLNRYFDLGLVGMAVKSLNKGWVEVNDRLCEILGYPKDELLQMTWAELTHPQDLTSELAKFNQVLAGERDGYTTEKRFIRKDGGVVYAHASVKCIRRPDGTVDYFLALVQDMTQRERTKEALQESEARYRALTNDVLDTSQVGMSILDARFRVIWVNQSFERFFGIPRKELISRDMRDLVKQRLQSMLESPEAFVEEKLRAYAEGAPIKRFECHVLAGGGRQECWLDHSSQPIHTGLYSGGRIEQYDNITERRQAEQALLQAQKMDAIGQLTGGIAHDFNNLLTVIMGNLQLLEGFLQGQTRLQRLAQEAWKASRRGSELVRKLLAFSRRQYLQPKVIDLNRLVLDMWELLNRTLGESIEVRVRRADNLWKTLADPGQVETALLNMVLNARDAMPHGGQLSIETSNVHLDDEAAMACHDLWPGRYVTLAVSDTGIGMPAEVAEHVFEPFFTTKQIGKGSGLGLSMVYGFAKQSGGHVKIHSEPEQGTTVKLYLPRTDSVMDAEEQPIPQPYQARGETILVVEDYQAVRDVVSMLLSELGYQVFEAVDGRKALDILEQEPRIDLLFTDIALPGHLSGPALAREAQSHHPRLKVLFTSGYAASTNVQFKDLDEEARVLRKPYGEEDLASRIRQILDAE